MKVVVTDSVPASKRAIVRETVGTMLAASLARHPHYTHMMAVVGVGIGGRGWDVQIVPLDATLIWDEPFLHGIPELVEAVREALRVL